MQTTERKFRSLGVDVPVQVPATVADFDANAKKEGACLNEAINNIVYRGVLADFRDAFLHGIPDEVDKDKNVTKPGVKGVEEVTGIPRKYRTEKTGDKEVEVWDESEAKYLERVRVAKGWNTDNDAVDNAVLQPIANAIAARLVFDASASESKPKGPKKLPADYKTAAERIFANGTQAKWATQFGLTFVEEPGAPDSEEFKKARTTNVEMLGWKIREDVLQKEKERTAQYS